MENKNSKFIYWTPRIIGIIIVVFFALMSLDIFDLKLGFWGTVIGLFMHNIPTLILLLILIISWKYELVGGIAFITAGTAYLIALFINPFEWYMISWAVMISGSAFFTGALFLVGWNRKKKQ